MANEPIQGLPYPDLTGVPPNVPADIKALADAVAPRSVMRFASIAARDAALPAPVDGMVCYIGADNGYYVRAGGQWRVLWQDTGWQPLTADAGFTPTALGIRRIGREVFLRGAVTRDAGVWPGSSSVLTLPAGFRPAQWHQQSITGPTHATAYGLGVTISAAGVLSVYRLGIAQSPTAYLDSVRFLVD